jgi:phosphohistidine swiveling domain-containing protein
LSASQRELLLAVNAWLRRTNGGEVPVVAAAERAYELISDEKAFDSTPPVVARNCGVPVGSPSHSCAAKESPPPSPGN